MWRHLHKRLLVPGVALQMLVLIGRCSMLTATSPYVTHMPGELPIILSAPHGGWEQPAGLVERDHGCSNSTQCTYTHECPIKDDKNCRITRVTDSYTRDLTLEVREELYNLTGAYPHVIIMELKRTILDANRDIYNGAYGVPEVEAVWTEYHRAIDQSKSAIQGLGIFFDMHGQSHDDGWVEIGYLISGSNLDQGVLDPATTSIKSLASTVSERGVSFPSLVRGESSFGGLLQKHGYKVIPSPQHPTRAGGKYYSGGYNTKVHGSRDGGDIDAIQIESHSSQRFDSALRQKYAHALACTMTSYMNINYKMNLTSHATMPCSYASTTTATMPLLIANCALLLYKSSL